MILVAPPAAQSEALAPRPDAETAIKPFVTAYCIDCHVGDEAEAGLNFEKLLEAESIPHRRLQWERVVERLAAGEMPPEEGVQPEAAERASALAWLRAELADPDCTQPQNPGRATLHRLNRTEYRNTVRDLLGVEFDAAGFFPVDELGYGFDNNGDVLSLPPVLLEKYLQAAEEIARRAVVTPESIVEPRTDYPWDALHGGQAARDGAQGLFTNGRLWADAKFEQPGEYLLRVQAFATQAGDEPVRMRLLAGDRALRTVSVEAGPGDPQTYVARIAAEAGTLRVGVEFTNDLWQPWAEDAERRDRNLFVTSIAVVGPTTRLEEEELSPTQRRLAAVAPSQDEWFESDDWRQPTRDLLEGLLLRAYRRPARDDELERMAEFMGAARRRGDSFERALQLAVEATLCSPQFLLRGETPPADARGVRPLDGYELASRLSYFLWSSMPDDELLAAAADGTLLAGLDAQVGRMLASDKSDELIRNFGEQWLETRRLATLERDPERFPEFDDELRSAMREETFRLLADVVRNDRPLTTLLSADYSFINARLAKHYGLSAAEGLGGEEFRRVELPAERRAGVLAHGSVLAVTAFADRTSPVLRGKWVLDHLLADPPPPPPPSAGSLPEPASGAAPKSLRERLEMHLADATCASCHKRMDPLGMALENFDAVGRWREFDGEEKIDANGQLPDGRQLTGAVGLRDVLLADFARVRRAIAERLLTYALGRGLEPYDRCAVNAIVAAAEANGDTFANMVRAIVKSAPFLQRDEGRGE
ncbi:MAG: DUF1592 domain-containing protein [Pirellulales bacterium]|nr:DUF1592 domain-containing protein [Pirellulales bacterium]